MQLALTLSEHLSHHRGVSLLSTQQRRNLSNSEACLCCVFLYLYTSCVGLSDLSSF